MISDRTKQLVDKYIQEGMNSPTKRLEYDGSIRQD